MQPTSNLSSPNPLHDEIARLAYSFFEGDSRRGGHDLDHWLRAEAQLAPNDGFRKPLENTDVPAPRSRRNPRLIRPDVSPARGKNPDAGPVGRRMLG